MMDGDKAGETDGKRGNNCPGQRQQIKTPESMRVKDKKRH